MACIPRPTIRLAGKIKAPSLIKPKTNRIFTDTMAHFRCRAALALGPATALS
jgi:hypothetical protein